MPRPVDHQQRRATLVDITARQIAEVGLGGVRLRDVARAAGWTTGAVSHYFPDKRTLLLSTFRSRTEMAGRRITEAIVTGDDELLACIDALLPLTAEQLLTWQVWLAFWGAAVGDPILAAEQYTRQQLFVDNLTERVLAEQRAGSLRADLAPVETATFVAALIDGTSIQATFAPDRWPAAEQQRFVREHLAPLR